MTIIALKDDTVTGVESVVKIFKHLGSFFKAAPRVIFHKALGAY
jgi:hypothetical protein